MIIGHHARLPDFWRLVDALQEEYRRTGRAPIPILRAFVLLGERSQQKKKRKNPSRVGKNIKPRGVPNRLKDEALQVKRDRAWAEVAKTGDVRKAADALGVSKATLYRLIRPRAYGWLAPKPPA